MAQSRLVWTVDTVPGNHVGAVQWCACGGVTYPGMSGRWLAKNVRRTYCGATLPAWHRAMTDLRHGPGVVFARPLPQASDAPNPGEQLLSGRTIVETSPSPVVQPPESAIPGEPKTATTKRCAA